MNRLKRSGAVDTGRQTECIATTRVTYKDSETGEVKESLMKKEPQYYATRGADSTYTVNFTCPEGSKEIEALVMIHDAILLQGEPLIHLIPSPCRTSQRAGPILSQAFVSHTPQVSPLLSSSRRREREHPRHRLQ